MASRAKPALSTERASLQLSVQFPCAQDASTRAPSRAQVRRWVRSTLDALSSDRSPLNEATLTFRFVDVDEGRTLNRTFRGKDYATNVLTFPFDDAPPGTLNADIAICLPVVAREADAQGKTLHDHCAHLVVHGTLHASGHEHDDPKEADAMEALERRVLARFRIADPYVEQRVGDRVGDRADPR